MLGGKWRGAFEPSPLKAQERYEWASCGGGILTMLSLVEGEISAFPYALESQKCSGRLPRIASYGVLCAGV
jgi:hypothetical protein